MGFANVRAGTRVLKRGCWCWWTQVPFHVTYIKNVSRIIDPGGRFVELRINFWTPATGGSSVDRPLFKDTDAQFLKEITLKSSNLTKINANYQVRVSYQDYHVSPFST